MSENSLEKGFRNTEAEAEAGGAGQRRMCIAETLLEINQK